MAVVSAASVLTPITAEASSNYSMRKKVVVAAGIMRETSDDSAPVTRAQFAEMLVKASTLSLDQHLGKLRPCNPERCRQVSHNPGGHHHFFLIL